MTQTRSSEQPYAQEQQDKP